MSKKIATYFRKVSLCACACMFMCTHIFFSHLFRIYFHSCHSFVNLFDSGSKSLLIDWKTNYPVTISECTKI